jgi:cupin superfamily acireductone dioxygenase involved in methionine salvage
VIDWTINAGHLLTIALILFAVTGFYYKTLFDGKVFKEDIIEIKSDLKTLNKLLTDVALQKQGMDYQGQMIAALQRDVQEMRRGRGFIQRDLVGEYDDGGKR